MTNTNFFRVLLILLFVFSGILSYSKDNSVSPKPSEEEEDPPESLKLASI